MFLFHIPLPPVSWQAALRSRNFFYDPKAKEKKAVRQYISQQYTQEPLTCYTAIEFLFCFKVPKSTSKKKAALMLAGEIIPTRADCTNCQKLYEDCLKKIVIDDDRNVAEIHSKKIYGEKEEIIIKVYELKEYRCESS